MAISTVLLIIGGLLAGALGGLFHPWIWGVQGAVLGAGMSVSAAVMNRLERKRLDEGQGPRWRTVGAVAGATGLTLGVLLTVYRSQAGAPAPALPIPLNPVPAGWPVLAQSLVLVLAMHAAYRLRWYGAVLTFLAPWLVAGATVGVIMVSDLLLHRWDDPASSLLLALVGGLPLGLGWGIVAAWCDPAYMPERWGLARPKP